jgi:hypothetical protein
VASPGSHRRASHQSVARVPVVAAIGLVPLCASASRRSQNVRPPALGRPDPYLNVELTTKAWDQFNRGAFDEAIKAADKCIDEFQGQADREQDKLRKARVPLPPTGKPANDKEKNAIMARGVLNDVATCFYIKARSAENLKRVDQAKDAYRVCKEYTHARTWDPQGWFWSPSEVCSDRSGKLK